MYNTPGVVNRCFGGVDVMISDADKLRDGNNAVSLTLALAALPMRCVGWFLLITCPATAARHLSGEACR